MKIGKINNIQQLAPTFVENFTDLESSSTVWDTYQDLVEKYKQQIGLAKKYFFYNSHDSDVLLLKKINGKDLQLILNDISALEFACALIDKKELPIDKEELQFPVEISSRGTRHVSLNIVDAQSGELSPCRFRKVDEYLYEEIIIWEEKNIEIAFDLWSNRSNPTNRYVLLLSCEQLDINEKQFTAWQNYFPAIYIPYFGYFNTKRNEGQYLSDYTTCLKLIDEYEVHFAHSALPINRDKLR